MRVAIHVGVHGALLAVGIVLIGCANTDKMTFANYGTPKKDPNAPPPTREELLVPPAVSDGLAINYANSVEIVMRSDATRSRITREVSNTLQVGLAAFGGVGAAFHFSSTTLAILGLGSAGIPQLQAIFNARERAQIYNQAADMIRDGVLEYYSHNPSPSSTSFTPNGLTLVKRVTAAISLVDTALIGQLPSRKQMLQAVEEMTPEGTHKQKAGAAPVNTVGASTHTVVQKLTPVIIEKTVPHSVGLQSDQVLAITRAAGTLLKGTTTAQAQAVADKVGITVAANEDPREALSKTLGDSSITASRAADILKNLQAQASAQ